MKLRKKLEPVAIAAAIMMLGAACGGGEETASELASTADDVEESTTTSTEPELEDEGDTGLMVDGGDLDDVSAAYCAAAAEAEIEAEQFVDFFNPQALEGFVNEQLDTMRSIEAPAEIADDFALLITGQEEFQAVLEENGYDVSAVGLDNIGADTPEMTAAGERVDAWEDANCPEVEMPEEAVSSDEMMEQQLSALLESDSGRALLIQQIVATGDVTEEQAGCFIDNTEPEVLVSLATEATAGAGTLTPETLNGMTEAMVACDISLENFTGLSG